MKKIGILAGLTTMMITGASSAVTYDNQCISMSFCGANQELQCSTVAGCANEVCKCVYSGGVLPVLPTVTCAKPSDCGAIEVTTSDVVTDDDSTDVNSYSVQYRACLVATGECASVYSTVSRCGYGYYGNGTTCTRCPSIETPDGLIYSTSSEPLYVEQYSGDGVYCRVGQCGTVTISGGASSITSCYVPDGTALSNASGYYEVVGNCYYK